MNRALSKEICIDKLLVPFEGTGPLTPNGDFIAYRDPGSANGLPITIAWGLTYDEEGSPVKTGDIWSVEKAKKVKSSVLDDFCAAILKSCPVLENESDYKFAAVLSFCYNVGMSNFNSSTLKKKILVRDWDGAAKEFQKWNKAGGKVMNGLTRRRRAEADLFLTNRTLKV